MYTADYIIYFINAQHILNSLKKCEKNYTNSIQIFHSLFFPKHHSFIVFRTFLSTLSYIQARLLSPPPSLDFPAFVMLRF